MSPAERSQGRPLDWNLTPLEAAGLEELADLQKSDPEQYAEILSAKSEQQQEEQHGAALLNTLKDANTSRQERDGALLDRIFEGSSEASQGQDPDD